MSKINESDKSQMGQKDTPSAEQTNPNMIDVLLGKSEEKIVDFESMILETQKRVWGALKQGYEYVGITDDSEKFLRKNVFAKFDTT